VFLLCIAEKKQHKFGRGTPDHQLKIFYEIWFQGASFFFRKECYGHWQMTAPTTKDDKLQQYNMLPFRSDEFKKHETWIENKKIYIPVPFIYAKFWICTLPFIHFSRYKTAKSLKNGKIIKYILEISLFYNNRVHEYCRSCQSWLPKFHKVRYFSILSQSDCPTVRLAKKSVVVRWEIVGNWIDHNWTGSRSFSAMFFRTVTS
jgi:hypothetical protein